MYKKNRGSFKEGKRNYRPLHSFNAVGGIFQISLNKKNERIIAFIDLEF
jgi:hypothetical protein